MPVDEVHASVNDDLENDDEEQRHGNTISYLHRPRVLYASTFIWLTCVGGRFLAPFLEHEASLDSAEIGQALGLQQIIIMLMSSIAGVLADRLEVQMVVPSKGRLMAVLAGVSLSTLAFLLHGIRYVLPNSSSAFTLFFSSSIWHILLQGCYGATISVVFPVLDAITIDKLNEQNRTTEYGKERLHGPLWWAVSNLLLSPLLDRYGFTVCYPLAILSYLFVLWTAAVYYRGSTSLQQRRQTTEFTILTTQDGDVMEEDNEYINTMTDTDTDTDTDTETDDSEVTPPPPGSATMCGLLMIIVRSGFFFLLCLVCISAGQAMVDNLVFLFFEQLGSSFLVLGLTVVVKIAFEVPVFYYGDALLEGWGPTKVLLIGCLCYVIRVFAYTFIPFGDVVYVLLLEPLHGITYGASQIAMVEFAAKVVPTGNEATTQGLVYFFREFGGVFGVFFGGWAEEVVGPRVMFRATALMVLLIGMLPLMVASSLLRRRYRMYLRESNSTMSATELVCPNSPDINEGQRRPDEDMQAGSFI